MTSRPQSTRVIHFGLFEADLESRELRKRGVRLKVHEQTFQLLIVLLERPGEVIPREELRQRLWPDDTFVDFDHGINTAVKKLRNALGDTADNPRFIETLARRGYRFIAPVDGGAQHVREPENGQPVAAVQVSEQSRTNREVLLAVLALGVTVAAVTGAIVVRARSSGTAGDFQSRDWVLIAGFENRTGESLFDGTLQYALERELSNSRFVRPVPRERVGDVLRLMQKPADTNIDAALGREVCLRDGNIRALLTGRADKLGTAYVFSVRLFEPGSGTILRGAEEQAESHDKVWPAMRKLSNWVRNTLGEELASIKKSNEQLAKVTTPSLRALQLYSKGFYRQALVEDPNFAMAHMMLACNFWASGKDWKPETERALQLSGKVSERERLFIEGGNYQHHGQLEKAAEEYEALLQLYPDEVFGLAFNLDWIYQALGRLQEKLALDLKYARARPHDYDALVCAAQSFATIGRDLPGARRYIEQARPLESPGNERATGKFFSVHDYWLQDDPASGLRELARIMSSMNDEQQRHFAGYAGQLYLAFGRLKAAEEWFQRMDDEADKLKWVAFTAYCRGDQPRTRSYVAQFRKRYKDDPGMMMPILQARLGPGDEPDQFLVLLNAFQRCGKYPERASEVKGEYALAQGHTIDAIFILQDVVNKAHAHGEPTVLSSADSLATAHEEQAEPEQALRVLDQASHDRFLTLGDPDYYGESWNRIQAHLARQYQHMGRVEDARKVKDQLRRLLAYADPDYHILPELMQ